MERLYQEGQDGDDARHYYYVAFVDLFFYCINVPGLAQQQWALSDEYLTRPVYNSRAVTTWQLFNPYHNDTRAFHAGDLPDFFSALTDIPLHGEQHKPSYMMGKVFQKCLPFCGQRRKLIEVVKLYNQESPAFWRVFSKVFWCMLAGMYPGDKGRPQMQELLRIRQITDTASAKTRLTDALQIGEYEGSALIVFSAFRRYMIYMADENVHYTTSADRCIDWSIFRSDTIIRAELIRGSNLLPNDVFGRARILITKMDTNTSKVDVYRYRKISCIKMIAYHCNTMLEKLVYQSIRDWEEDQAILDKIIALPIPRSLAQVRKLAEPSVILEAIFNTATSSIEECIARATQKITWNLGHLERPIAQEVKEALLNVLVKVPIEDRLKPLAFGLLRLPKYGGVSMTAVEVLRLMVSTYYTNPVPRKFQAQLRRLSAYDFKAVCCYINIMLRLDKINFVIWDADTVQGIDYAMKHKRNILFPGQKVPAHTYNVLVKICCQRIATFPGRTFFGHNRVAYDINTRYLVCSKKRGKKDAIATPSVDVEDDDDDDDEGGGGAMENGVWSVDALMAPEEEQEARDTARKEIRRQRKDFMHIPCSGQPVMSINLRGMQLIWGNERDKKIRYCHCPQCGSYHEFKWKYFSKSVTGKYRCGECYARDLTTHSVFQCSYCLERPRRPISCQDAVKTSLVILHPLDAEQPLHLEYFCKKHYRYASYKASQLPKTYLWAYIRKKEQNMRLRAATGFFQK